MTECSRKSWETQAGSAFEGFLWRSRHQSTNRASQFSLARHVFCSPGSGKQSKPKKPIVPPQFVVQYALLHNLIAIALA